MQTALTTTRSGHSARFGWLAARGAALLGAAGLAAVAAGAAGAASAPTSAADKALFTYAKCMRDSGVKIPDPVQGKDGRFTFPTISAAVTGAAGVRAKAQACASSSGAGRGGQAGSAAGSPGGFRGGFGQQTPAQQAAFKKFQDCLKTNGVTLPTGGRRPQPPAGTSATPLTSTTGKAGTAAKSTVIDPKTGKAITRPTILGQGPNANSDDAGPGGGRGGPGGRGGFFGGDAKSQAALAKCRALLPAGTFGSRGPRPGTASN